jgi:methionyl-tRNA formyltransferase
VTSSDRPVKITLMTTDTTHHTYYAWKLSQHFPLQAIFVETRRWAPPFETFHPFEAARDIHEKDVLFANCNGRLSDFAETHVVESVNTNESVAALESLAPDVVIIFGTGKVSTPVIKTAQLCLNLHGGNPEHYRGLDTHLWAIYHRDFDNLVTTLHQVEPEFDTGDIIFQTQLKLNRDTRLHELRAINTDACVTMSRLALAGLELNGSLPSRKQVSRGRYYSGMPGILKEDCLRKFEQHVMQV